MPLTQISFLACPSILFCGTPQSLFPSCWIEKWNRIFSFVTGTGKIPPWWPEQFIKMMMSYCWLLSLSCEWLKCVGAWWPVPRRTSDEIPLYHCLLLCWFLSLWTSVSSSVKLELSPLRASGRRKLRFTPLPRCLLLANTHSCHLHLSARGPFIVEPLAFSDLLEVRERKIEDDSEGSSWLYGGTI